MPASSLPFVSHTIGGRDDEALPWIVAIHGLGDQPASFVRFLDGAPLRAHVFAPEGLYPHGNGFDWFRTPVRGDEERTAAAVERAMAELLPWIETRSRDRLNVGKPVVFGFSQGGVLTYALALGHPERFRAAIALGGRLPKRLWPTEKPATRLPLLALHGVDDRVVPIGPARALTAHLETLGHDVAFEEFPGVAHRVPRAMRQRLVEFLAGELGQ